MYDEIAMKKYALILQILFVSLLYFFSAAAIVSADTNGSCWFPPSGSGVNGCDKLTDKNFKQCPQEILTRLDSQAYKVYETQDDCKKNQNQLLPVQPTAIPLPTTDPSNPTTNSTTEGGNSGDGVGYELSPSMGDIYDITPVVTITATDPEIPPGAFICLEADMCIDNDAIREGLVEGNQSVVETASLGLDLDKVDEDTLQRYVLVNGKITICGDGNKKAKASVKENYKGAEGKDPWWGKIGKDRQGCKPERDYFHAGKSYVFAIYTKGDSSDGKTWVLLKMGGFYVNHFFPEISFTPPNNFNPNSTDFSFNVSVKTLENKAIGVKSNIEDRNNYQVEVRAPGYSEIKCGWSTTQKGAELFKFKPPVNTLLPGKFRLYIREQVNEDPMYKEHFNKAIDSSVNVARAALEMSRAPGGLPKTAFSICQGGFVYRQYNCTLARSVANKQLLDTTCEANKTANPEYNPELPEGPTNKKYLYPIYIDDPGKVDVKGLLAYFDLLGVNATADKSNYPCNIGGATQNDPSGCKNVETAIGKLPVDPLGFIMKVFSIVLSFAGVGAIILIIFSGYRLMMSRGNPEMIKSARETLTAAVVGLFFIVFSLVLLSIVAENILKIPGFS